MTESSDTYTAADDLLPIGDVARALGVAVATVRRWDAAGHIESVRTPGGQRRFRRSEVERLRGPAAS
jgi:excisionase family DNA binding protein